MLCTSSNVLPRSSLHPIGHYTQNVLPGHTLQKNLADDSLREVAKTKAAAARKAAESATDDNAPKYRDRALERRAVYGQPDVPLPNSDGGSGAGSNGNGSKRKYAEGPAAPPKPPTPPLPPLNPGEDSTNKGNMLLKKMGWSAGTGLGLSGEGRVDPMCGVSLLFGARVA